jgi:hypothetical protein
MSELMNVRMSRGDLRWNLLTSVSALALLGFVCGAGKARAADDDTDRPTVWIELGGQLEQVDGSEERFAPPFLLTTPRSSVQTISPISVEKPPRFSNGAEGSISFEPAGTDWVLSASVRYGRANGSKHVHQQSYPASVPLPPPFVSGVEKPEAARLSDTRAQNDETHAVLDFQAGKDFGLGVLGNRSSSILSLGVRFAQFSAKSNAAIKSDPDARFHYLTLPSVRIPFGQIYHTYNGAEGAARSFRGVGPSLAWNASTPIAGSSQQAGFTVDWGVHVAVLFGRQKAATHHQTTAQYHPFYYGAGQRALLYQTATAHSRKRSVVVPNIGGFAGISLRFPNAKVSLGYRGDFFFGAMDGGIDTHRSESVGFYGPFATISVGVGGGAL